MRVSFSFVVLLLGCLLFQLGATSLLAQDTLRERYGIFGHFAIGFHSADFQTMPGTRSCCAGFTGGSGAGFIGGVLVELPFAENLLLGGRASFMHVGYSMAQTEATRIIVAGVGQDGAFEHRLSGSLSWIGLEFSAQYRLWKSLFLHGGLRAAYPLSGNFEQKDQLTEPAGAGTFLDENGQDSKKRTRNEYSGDIPNSVLHIAPVVGASYELPLNRRHSFFLAPELLFQFGLNSLTKDVDWNLSALRLGLALKYSPPPPKQIIDQREERTDTLRVEVPTVVSAYSRGEETQSTRMEETDVEILRITTVSRTDTVFFEPKRYVLTASLSAVGIAKDGRETSAVTLTTDEFISITANPLLNYVFFESGSPELPARYQKFQPAQAATFVPEAAVYPDKMSAYYNVMNIIGSRLRNNPSATITLTGCTDEQGIEAGNTDLSRRRAESVKTYLTGIFGIAPERIAVAGRLLPQKPARSQSEEAYAENRRVEITSNTDDILAPVIGADTLRTANPPIVRFKPQATAEAGMAKWTIRPEYGGTVLKEFSGGSSLPPSVDWAVERESAANLNSDKPIRATLTITDERGESIKVTTSMNVDATTNRKKRLERMGNNTVERFSVVLFDINSADLSGIHKRVGEYIRRWIAPTAPLKIVGYADLSGDPAVSKRLAEGRASAVAKALGVSGRAQVEGRTENLYDSGTPEGRFYSRTVDIISEIPTE